MRWTISEKPSVKRFGIGVLVFWLVTILFLDRLDIHVVFEPLYVLPVLNSIFLAFIPLIVCFFTGRSFVLTQSPGMYFLGAGTLALAAGGLISGWLIGTKGGPNATITVYNSGALLGSAFHVAGALTGSWINRQPWAVKNSHALIFRTYLIIVFTMVTLTALAKTELTPLFIQQGVGPTVVGRTVLILAVTFFAVAGVIIGRLYLRTRSNIQYWYCLAMLLFALGLTAVMLQEYVGSPLGWAGRLAQYCGGLCFLLAMFSSFNAAPTQELPLDYVLANFFSDSQGVYQIVTETALDAIVCLGQNGRILLWNKGAEKIFGYSADEAVGSLLSDLVKWNLPPQRDYKVSEHNRAEIHGPAEAELTRKNGRKFPAEISISARMTTSGLISVLVARDITFRKEAEKELIRHRNHLEELVQARTRELEAVNLKLSETIDRHLLTNQALKQRELELLSTEKSLGDALQKLKFHMENSPLAVVEFDPEFRVTHWSKQAERIFGWSAEEVLGKGIDQIKWVYEEDVESVAALSADMLANRRTSNLHVNRNYRRDGSVITCEWYNSALVNAQGNLVSVFSLVLDITERLRSEKERERLITELRALVMEVHHRVKNNLQTLISLINLQMRKEQNSKVIERLQETQNRIVAMALVHESFYQSHSLAQVNLKQYVTKLTQAYDSSSALGRPGISLNLDIADNLVISQNQAVPCGLILNELITNAFKHAFTDGRSGEVSVTGRAVSQNGQELVVADNGVGLPPEINWQTSTSLGLSLVRILTEGQLGGTIEVSGGQGTRFRILFKRSYDKGDLHG